VAVAHLREEDARLLFGGEEGKPRDGERLRHAAGESPDDAGTRPRHAAQEAAAIDAVVARVLGDEVGARGARVALLVEAGVIAFGMLAHDGMPPVSGDRTVRRAPLF